jgi:hypothetical protein
MQSKNNSSPDVYKVQFAVVLGKFRVHLTIYTDRSKIGEIVACAAVCSMMPVARPLPDEASIFTAELVAVCLAWILRTEAVNGLFGYAPTRCHLCKLLTIAS